jgi:hypothetical protein
MTHSYGSVTTQRIAFKHLKALKVNDFELDLKALTDHFGGGSRVVSFDPYS